MKKMSEINYATNKAEEPQECGGNNYTLYAEKASEVSNL